jgi:ribosomal protein S13
MGGKIKFLLLIVGILIFSNIKIDIQAQELSESQLTTLLDDINNAFKVAGIERAYVQFNEIDNKIELTGVFKDYDEFLL